MKIQYAVSPLGGGWLLYRKEDRIFIKAHNSVSYELITSVMDTGLAVRYWDFFQAVEYVDRVDDDPLLPPLMPVPSSTYLHYACDVLGLKVLYVKEDEDG